MADFKFYLNRSGMRGAKGEKGDRGFSPTIVEGTNTVNEYTLKIVNEFDEFETPNLRGDNVDILDPNGTYVRYDHQTDKLYVASADLANSTDAGIIRIATPEDFEVFSNDTAVTPESMIDELHKQLVSPDGSISIEQNSETSKTELKFSGTGAINELEQRVTELDTKTDNIRADLTTEAQVREAADIQQQNQIDTERQERETQDASLQEQLNSKLTVDNIKEGNNITITRDGNNITINSTGGGSSGGGDVTSDGNNIFTGTNEFRGQNKLRVGNGTDYAIIANYSSEIMPVTESDIQTTEGLVIGSSVISTVLEGEDVFKRVWNTQTSRMELSPVIDATMVDNQTIKFDNGELKADLSEIGDEVNTLAGKVNTLETKVDELQLFKFPNATIEGSPTINNGQISNFNTTNYLRFPFEFKTEGRTWLLNGSFDTNTDVTTQQNIIDSSTSIALAVRNSKLVLALSTNGTNFNLGEHESTNNILANTKYYYRLSFSGTQYQLSTSTDKQEWLSEITIDSDQPIASKPMTISSPGHPFGGVINLNDYDLTVANTLVWQGMDDVGMASRMDVNASNITQTGIDKLKELLLGDIESLVDAINVNYDSNNSTSPVQDLAATPMMLSLETTELDVENSFTSDKPKAEFSDDLVLPTNSVESYDDDTDIDLGGNV